MTSHANQGACHIVWQVHGAPRQDECVEHVGLCWVCANEMQRGLSVEDWAGANFTGQNKVRAPTATHVCEPCLFVCSRIAPVLGRPAKEGKKFGGSFRNYSHLWDERLGYCNASKGEKPKIRDFLRSTHEGAWFGAIADSGQKHVLPWAPINPAGARRGVVLFDEQLVTLPVAHSAGWTVVDRMTELLTAGATKEEVTSGQYGARAWQLCGPSLARFEESWGAQRHSAFFSLAIWLAQRDEEQVATRMAEEKESRDAKRKPERKAQNRNRRSPARDKVGVPGEPALQCAEALGSDPGPDARGDANECEPRGVDNKHVPKASAPGTQQLLLFGGS